MVFGIATSAALLLFSAAGCAAAAVHGLPTGTTSQVDLFHKDDVYQCYKVPYLLQTVRGTLLAFVEARAPRHDPEGISPGNCMDWDITDMVMRRSEDNGATWGAIQVVVPGTLVKKSLYFLLQYFSWHCPNCVSL